METSTALPKSEVRTLERSRRGGGERGLTLVEVMICLVVLALLGGGIISAALQLRRATEAQVREQLAASVAFGFLEQARAVPFADMVAMIRTNTPLVLYTEAGTEVPVPLNSTTPISVFIPIVSSVDAANNVVSSARMAFDFTISVTFTSDMTTTRTAPADPTSVYGSTIRIDFSWESPSTGNIRNRSYSMFRSSVD